MDILWRWKCRVVIIGLLVFARIECLVNHKALLAEILRNYTKDIRPQCTDGQRVNVSVGIALRQILELDEPKQQLESSLWFRLWWYDCNIGWNPSEHDGAQTIIIPSNKIWLPDIQLYERVGEPIADAMLSVSVTLYADGMVVLYFPKVVKTICRVNVQYFPFDDQNCSLTLGSWAYNGLEIDVLNRSEAGDYSTYIKSGEWELIGIPMRRHTIYYNCCEEPYPDVTFYIHLRRMPLFYIINLLFPCMLISMVSMLTFWLPPDSGEKVSLGITVLLSLTVFLLVVSETMPATSEIIPLIGQYFTATILLVSMCCMFTVIVLNAHYKGLNRKPVPMWIRKYILIGLAKILMMTPVNKESRFNQKHTRLSHPYDAGQTWSTASMNGSCGHSKQNEETLLVPPEFTKHDELTRHVAANTSFLLRFQDRLVDTDEEDRLTADWMRFAMVVNRLFLVIYVLVAISMTLGIFLQVLNKE